MVERVRRGGHFGRLGEIAGLLVDTMIRHEMTDYDRLLRINGSGHGLTREEARMVVAAEVRDTAAAWRQGSPEADQAYAEFRRAVAKRRQKTGRRKDNPGVIANENADVATFLEGWLARQTVQKADERASV
ncbi:DUF2293 domain-containing protein [Aureimonas leprariae]|nr:DUF2293 domain-containing protein [Aureimonas leprariae]